MIKNRQRMRMEISKPVKDGSDATKPEVDSNKTGHDSDADMTMPGNEHEKSQLGVNPDSTDIDTEADKTKKEN